MIAKYHPERFMQKMRRGVVRGGLLGVICQTTFKNLFASGARERLVFFKGFFKFLFING